MKTYIDQKAKATREYQKYIFEECVKHIQSPKADYVEFKVIENITPFPKVVQALDDVSDRKFMQEETITPYQRRQSIVSEILTYTNKNLLPFCDFLYPKTDVKDGVNITFFFTITKPEKLFIKAKKLGIEIKSSQNKNTKKVSAPKTEEKIILHLNAHGDLWREPKDKYFYPMEEKSGRHRIVSFLSKYIGYQKTSFIAMEGDLRNNQTVRTAVKGINQTADRLLKLGGKKILENKASSGYRINPKYRITQE